MNKLNRIDARMVELPNGQTVSDGLGILSEKVKDTVDYNYKGFNNIDSVNFYSDNPTEPLITFLDDDGKATVYSRLYPIFQAKNTPLTVAVCSNLLGKPSYITAQQLREMHNSRLVEVVNHNSDHGAYLDVGGVEWERQVKEGKEWLYQNGYTHDVHVYPKGQPDPGYKIAKKYSKCAFDDVGHNNPGPLKTYGIKRIPFGSNFTGLSETYDLNYYKSEVDYCIANKTWLVFMVHIDMQEIAQDTILGQLIDYIKSVNVRVLNASDAYRIRANKLEINEKVVLDASGNLPNDYIGDNSVTLTTPITNYPKKISVVTISKSYSTNNGFPSGGSLITHRDQNEDLYNYQELQAYQMNERYVRFWNGTGWTAFEQLVPKSYLGDNLVTATTPITYFPKSLTSIVTIGSAHGASNGFPSGGTLITHRNQNDDRYNYQELQSYQKNEKYIRFWNGTAWTTFERIVDIPVIRSTSVITNATPLSSFSSGKITYNQLSSAQASSAGFPTTQGLTVITDRMINSAGYSKQTVRQVFSSDEWTRGVDSSDNWLPWEKVTKTVV